MSNTPPKPSWLNALNPKKEEPLKTPTEVLEEPAESVVAGEDESIAPLKQYETPPPLDLTSKVASKQAIGRGTRELPKTSPVIFTFDDGGANPLVESVPDTKLPFPFDAEAFGRHIIMPDTILDDGSMIEFKTASNNVVKEDYGFHAASCIPHHELQREPYNQVCNWSGLGEAEQVTQTGQQVLGELIEQLPKEYKESLLNGQTDSFQQQFDGLNTICQTCNGTGLIRRSIRHDVDDIEEWDDDCPDCIGTGASPTAIMPGLFNVPKGLEPGTYSAQLDNNLNIVNVMPFMPNDEALLPEPALGLEGREVLSSETWLGLMSPTESIAYDNHTDLVMQSNPLHAAHLIRLKGFKSKYLRAIITRPEMAEEHIRVAIVRGEDPGGWDNSDHRRIKQAQELIAKGFEVKAKAEARQRHRLYIQQTREAWKQAVEYRKSALEILNTDVSNKKEAFQLARDMSFNEYMARFEPED